MTDGWEKVELGNTGLEVSRLGIGSSYGVGGRDIEYAFERGINYFYWGSSRRPSFGRGVKRLARRHRESMCVVIQSYARVAAVVRPSLEIGLRRLGIDHADILLLGWWNKPPPQKLLDAAVALREQGKVKAIQISCHNRKTFELYLRDPAYDAIMVRYNAAHPGAETEVFPHVQSTGVVAYTATRWGDLLDPRKVGDAGPVPRASDCYRFALSHPAVDVCLTGPANRAELEEALRALDRGPMDADELAWMKSVGVVVRERAKLGQGRAVDVVDGIKDKVDTVFRALNL